MATPFKRLCFRTVRNPPARTPQHIGPIQLSARPFSHTPIRPSSTDETPADPAPDATLQRPAPASGISDAELDRLASRPGVEYTVTEGPHADDMGQVDLSALSSMAHQQLAAHREQRELVRIAAWEMPKLGALAKEFDADQARLAPLRWRYTTYMGEAHPAQNKVVVELDPWRLPQLSQAQRATLIKLAGARYDPSSRRVRMSCEAFGSQAQNKRFLADTVNRLVTEATEGADDFADVPFDFRHHRPKPVMKFPEAWKLTPERKEELKRKRNDDLLEEARRVEEGRIVSGQAVIEASWEAEAAKEAEAAQPVMVGAGLAQSRGAPPRGAVSRW